MKNPHKWMEHPTSKSNFNILKMIFFVYIYHQQLNFHPINIHLCRVSTSIHTTVLNALHRRIVTLGRTSLDNFVFWMTSSSRKASPSPRAAWESGSNNISSDMAASPPTSNFRSSATPLIIFSLPSSQTSQTTAPNSSPSRFLHGGYTIFSRMTASMIFLF